MRLRKQINFAKRAALYNQSEFGEKYPDSRFMVSDRWISATWIMGNNYRNPSGYYGSYPPAFLARIWPMFPDVKAALHLFSGSLTKKDVARKGVTVLRLDINPKCKPDINRNAEQFAHRANSFDLILADPPYSAEDAEHYGKPLCNKKKVLAECHKALKSGGTLAWMDQSIPMYRKDMWHWYGVISIYRSTNHRIRGVMLFEKI